MELEEEKMPQQAQREGGSTEEGEKRRPQPPPEPLRCPRCDSMSTKFCYYNNYSLSQPRYFCKTCKRYWTKGGALRNVPFGGGCRKSKRPRRSQTSYATARFSPHDSQPLPPIVDDHHHLQRQLFFNKNLAICSAPATNVGVGSMSHPSFYGLGGIEGGHGYCGLTLPPIQQFNHGITGGQLVDLHQQLPSLHRRGFVNVQAGSLEGPAPPLLSAMMGATSSTTSQFEWQQRVFSPISATTPTVNAITERNDQQLLWQKNPYV